MTQGGGAGPNSDAGFDEENLSLNDFLGGRVQLWQPREGYRAGGDPVLLAAAMPAPASIRIST